MPRIIRTWPAYVMFGCLLLSVLAAVPSGGDEPDLDGPLLMLPNPAYLSNRQVETEPPREAATEALSPSQAANEPPAEIPDDEDALPADDTAPADDAAPVDDAAPADDAAKTAKPSEPAKVEPEPKRELTEAMTALRDRVRKTLALYRQPLLNTRDNSATEMMYACLPFGCRTNVMLGGTSGKKINGITCLCWNYPCAGFKPLSISEGRISGRIGYGLQERPSQLLATLALALLEPTYPIRVGEDIRTAADLVEYEKLSCRSETELSLKLIGLTHFVKEPTWQNDLGETWSLDRIVREELGRPIAGAPNGGMDRLMGLSYALYRREKRKQPIDGDYSRARKFIAEFHDYALAHQVSDGTWSTNFLGAAGSSRDQTAKLRSTGRVLRWLALSLPEDQLENAKVVRSVSYVNGLLADGRYRSSLRSARTSDIASVMHALHALSLYDERFFRPADAKKPAAGDKPAAVARRG